MRVAVDIGNRNIKLAYKKGDTVVFDIFESRFTSEEQQDYSNAEVIEINDTKYCIEQGTYDFEFNKTQKDYLPLLLCAIARATREEDVELMIGAPAEHVIGLRNDFKDQLNGKIFDFKYKGEDRKVRINKLGVIAEGFATYFAIPKAIRNTGGNMGIIDIGGRTVNVATFINGKQDKVCTLNTGLLDIKNNMLKELKKQGKDYDINTVENLIKNDRLNINEKDKNDFIAKVKNDIKIDKIDIDLYDWFLTGGGAIDIGDKILNDNFGKNCIIKDAIFTNVYGYYNFMIAKWGDK